MKSFVLAFMLVLVMSVGAFAAGPYTVYEIRPAGDELAVVVNRTTDDLLITGYLADDANKKYYLSVFLTALSTGKSVNIAASKVGDKWYYSMVRLYCE
jgi:predicted aconitase with swiveling domain